MGASCFRLDLPSQWLYTPTSFPSHFRNKISKHVLPKSFSILTATTRLQTKRPFRRFCQWQCFCNDEESQPFPFSESNFLQPDEDNSTTKQGACYLKKLTIQDFVLVKNQVIHFNPGFNVITGESGSGKSVLIEALSQVLGKTSLGNCIRTGSEMAVLEGTFHLSPSGLHHVRFLFRQFDVPSRALAHLNEDFGGELIIRREVNSQKNLKISVLGFRSFKRRADHEAVVL